jgi:hypothetical protein
MMMKSGMSPIMTLNSGNQEGGSNKVSDLFQNLVIPNWVLSYNMNGGTYKDESDSDDSDIDDELHDKLLDLATEKNPKFDKQNKKRKTRKQTLSKKGGTKKQKIDKK